MEDSKISINKFISNTGHCSRREADKLIEQGRVHINGQEAKKGNRVNDKDEIMVDFELLNKSKKKKNHIYILLNKPEGIVCTTDEKEKDNIISFLNHRKRIFPIGRLDKNSTGLILLTNDGDIVNKILRKENKNEKEYVVTTKEPINSEFIIKMSSGVRILGKKTLKCKVKKIGPKTFNITLTQGLNRQIRRMCNALGHKVAHLSRTRIMHLRMGKLKAGQWRYLEEDELEILKNTLNH